VHESNARILSVELSLSQTSKRYEFLIISYVFSSTKSENKRARRFCPEEWIWGEVQVAQTRYIHVSKCKNDKKKSFL
jgi:hypothetical protein